MANGYMGKLLNVNLTERKIDEEKLSALTDEQFLEFRKSGVLPFIYFHLMSMANFRDLSQLATG